MGLQGLLLSLLVTDELSGSGAVHLRPIQLQCQYLILLLLCIDGLLVAINVLVQQDHLVLGFTEKNRKKMNGCSLFALLLLNKKIK